MKADSQVARGGAGFSKAIQSGEAVLGTFVSISSPNIVEVVGLATKK
jgi:2-keto-3-deoxy-L-rhamnonate aldolase RhmA